MPTESEAQFSKGEHVVHFVMGICLVEEVGPVRGVSAEGTFYHLKPVHILGSVKYYISVGKEMGAIRRLATKAELEKTVAVLSMEPKKQSGMPSRRMNEARQKLNSGNVSLVAEVIRDVSPRGQGQSLSYRTVFESACTKFVLEYAWVNNLSTEKALQILNRQTKSILDLMCAEHMIVIPQSNSANPYPM